jgi:hypothetical protein
MLLLARIQPLPAPDLLRLAFGNFRSCHEEFINSADCLHGRKFDPLKPWNFGLKRRDFSPETKGKFIFVISIEFLCNFVIYMKNIAKFLFLVKV